MVDNMIGGQELNLRFFSFNYWLSLEESQICACEDSASAKLQVKTYNKLINSLISFKKYVVLRSPDLVFICIGKCHQSMRINQAQ